MFYAWAMFSGRLTRLPRSFAGEVSRLRQVTGGKMNGQSRRSRPPESYRSQRLSSFSREEIRTMKFAGSVGRIERKAE